MTHTTVTLQRPLPTQAGRGPGPTLPAGTQITITPERPGRHANRHLQLILAQGQAHVVYDHDLARAQQEP